MVCTLLRNFHELQKIMHPFISPLPNMLSFLKKFKYRIKKYVFDIVLKLKNELYISVRIFVFG